MFDPEEVEPKRMEDFDDPRGLFVRQQDWIILLGLYRNIKWMYDDLCK